MEEKEEKTEIIEKTIPKEGEGKIEAAATEESEAAAAEESEAAAAEESQDEKKQGFFRKVWTGIKKGYSYFNIFFSTKSNLYTGLTVVLLPIVLTLAVEMISRSSFLAGFQFLFQH